MPQLVRLYITQTAIGFAVAAIFTGLVVVFDIGRVGYLVTHVEGGWLAAFLFFMLNGIVFAGVQFGISVMRMEADEDTPPRGPGSPERDYAAIPVVVRKK